MTLLLRQKLPRRRGIMNSPPSSGTHLSAETRYGNRRLTPTFCPAAIDGARQKKQKQALDCSSLMAGGWSELPRAHRTSQTPLIVSWWVGTGRSTHHAAWTVSQCFLRRHKALTEVAPTPSPPRRLRGSMAIHRLRSSSCRGALFHRSGLTRRSSRPAYGGRLSLLVECLLLDSISDGAWPIA